MCTFGIGVGGMTWEKKKEKVERIKIFVREEP